MTGPQNTTLTINPITGVKFDDEVTISGQLYDPKWNLIPNQKIKLTINGKEVEVITINGVFEYTSRFKTLDEQTITAVYKGSDSYLESNATTSFTIAKQDILIIFDNISNVKFNENVTINGRFIEANGKAISNSNVNVYINGKQYKAKTDQKGVFTLTTQVKAIGTNNVTLSYGGNDKYNSFETNTTFNAGKQDLLITCDTIKDTVCGDNVTITGKFTDINGKAISNSNVNVYINGKHYKAKTDSTGAFKLQAPTKVVGTNNVTLSYGGNAYYNSFETTTTFNVIAKVD